MTLGDGVSGSLESSWSSERGISGTVGQSASMIAMTRNTGVERFAVFAVGGHAVTSHLGRGLRRRSASGLERRGARGKRGRGCRVDAQRGVPGVVASRRRGLRAALLTGSSSIAMTRSANLSFCGRRSGGATCHGVRLAAHLLLG